MSVMKKGNYTGKYERFVVGRKAEMIKTYALKNDINLQTGYAVGDNQGRR